MNSIVCIIKTFEREKCLRRLLSSIQKFHPELKVIIADDSLSSYKEPILKSFGNIIEDYFVLPYNVGPSVGRNYLLESTRTPFFLYCDDDFIFNCKIDFKEIIDTMIDNNLDIIGGRCIDSPSVGYRIVSFFSQIFIKKNIVGGLRLLYQLKIERNGYGYFDSQKGEGSFTCTNSNKGNKFITVDFVQNFFIGQTKKLQLLGGWKGVGKIGNDHYPFFLKMKGLGARIGFLKNENFQITHRQIFSFKYLLKRFSKSD